jgi:PAS domain S-box-containing protein
MTSVPGLHADEVADLRRQLAEKNELLEALQVELEQTNRGVVALYAELDDQAEKLRLASQVSESKFQTIYSQAPSGIALLDNDGWIVDGNPALAKLLTMVDFSVVGRRLIEFVPTDYQARVSAFCSPVAMSQLAQEVPVKRPDGSLAYVEWNVSAQIEPGLTMVVATDVSQRVEMENRRVQWLHRERIARGQAENGNRLKDDFIAVLSHELRNPLNAIMGWTQVLRPRVSSDVALRGIDAIERNCATQARMIADLMDMSRLNMGKLAMTFESVDPLKEISSALDSMRLALEQKAIVANIQGEGPYRPVRADASRLQQVIWNLVSNAIKFSSHGATILVTLVEDETGLRVRVKDSGQGIGKDFLPFVFERFAQGDVASNRHRGGLGLGLAIVRQIIDAHSGTISVHSEGPGLGTTFEFWLPVDRSHPVSESPHGDERAAQEVDASPDYPLGGRDVLIVDDDVDALAMLRIILADRGAQVRSATSAEEALSLIRQREPDVLVSDIGMPGKDGYDFIREIRLREAAEAPSAHATRRIPAIALTSFTRDEDRNHAIACGFDAYCTKPFRPLVLVHEILLLL